MTATVGFPTLRLLRGRMENLLLDAILPGQVRKLCGDEQAQRLNQLTLR